MAKKKALKEAKARLEKLHESIEAIEDLTTQHCISELQGIFLMLLKA